MPPIATWYGLREKQGDFGSVFFLKQLQKIDSSGGGENLLGSMVQWIHDFGGPDFAIPQCMGTPRALLNEVEKRKNDLGITDATKLRIDVAPGTEHIKID